MQRLWLFLGTAAAHAVAGVPLAFALTPDPPRILDGVLVGTFVFANLGVLALGIAEAAAPYSFRVMGNAVNGWKRLFGLGAAVGAINLSGGVFLSLTLWTLLSRESAWPLIVAILAMLFLIAPMVVNLAARMLRRRFAHPTPLQELRIAVRSGRPRKPFPNPHTTDHPLDRMWRQPGPAEMSQDQFAQPIIKEWVPFDPGSDVRPIRKKSDRGRLEGAGDQLFLSEAKCAHCQAVGAIMAQGPVRHACPRCRKGLLKAGIAWIT